MPLTVAILQVDTTVKRCIEYRSKNRGAKRMKLDKNEKCSTNVENLIDVKKIIEECPNATIAKEITGEELTKLLKENFDKSNQADSDSSEETSAEDEYNENDDHLTRAIINSFCDPEVIKVVKNNLIHNFS